MSFQRFINPTRRSNSSLGPISSGVPPRPPVYRPPVHRGGGMPRMVRPQNIRGVVSHPRQVIGRQPLSNTKRLEELQSEKKSLLQKLKDNERLEKEIKEKAELARKKKEEEDLENIRKEMERLQNALREKEMHEKWIREKNDEDRRKQEEKEMLHLQQNKDKIKQQIQEYEETAVRLRDQEELLRIKQEKEDIERKWMEVKESEAQKKRIEHAELIAKQQQEAKRQELERIELDRIERETQQLREQLRNKSQTEEWLEKRVSQERAEYNIAEAIRKQKRGQSSLRGKPIIRSSLNSSGTGRVKKKIQAVPTRAFNYGSDTDSTDDLGHLLPTQDSEGFSDKREDTNSNSRHTLMNDLNQSGDEDEFHHIHQPSPFPDDSIPVSTDSSIDSSQDISKDYADVLERITKDIELSRQGNVLGRKEADSLTNIYHACKSIEAKQPVVDDEPLSRDEVQEITGSKVNLEGMSKPANIIPDPSNIEFEQDSNITELTKTMAELKSSLQKNGIDQGPAKNPLRDIPTPSSCVQCNIKK